MAAPHQQHVRAERRVVKGPVGAKARLLFWKARCEVRLAMPTGVNRCLRLPQGM